MFCKRFRYFFREEINGMFALNVGIKNKNIENTGCCGAFLVGKGNIFLLGAGEWIGIQKESRFCVGFGMF